MFKRKSSSGSVLINTAVGTNFEI